MKQQLSFRPQQGLIIMNSALERIEYIFSEFDSFRPQQGLIIMNKKRGKQK